jgi:serine/threonine protein kinase
VNRAASHSSVQCEGRCRIECTLLSLLCGYRLAQDVTHQSETARVVFAEDEDELAESKLVALKLMTDPRAIEREVSQLHRSNGTEDARHLVRALRFHLTHDDAIFNTSGYKSCVVLPRGDRTLSDAIVHDMFAGRIDDVSAVARIRDVMLQLSAGLLHLHESCGAVHCDFKPMNAMQFGRTWKLIDFDSMYSSASGPARAYSGEVRGKNDTTSSLTA